MICREKEVVMKHLKKLSLVFIIILKCPNYGSDVSFGKYTWKRAVSVFMVKWWNLNMNLRNVSSYVSVDRGQAGVMCQLLTVSILSTDALNCLTQNNRRRRCWQLRHLHQTNCGPVDSTSIACFGRRGRRHFCFFLSNSLRFNSNTKFRQSCWKCR